MSSLKYYLKRFKTNEYFLKIILMEKTKRVILYKIQIMQEKCF